jgi:hypothetical protein
MMSVGDLLAHALGVVGWTVKTVEDDDEPRAIPAPGPAHGPVPAIDMRLKEQHRRVS